MSDRFRLPFLLGASVRMGDKAVRGHPLTAVRCERHAIARVGAHLIGPDVTELLPELTLARESELSAAEIARNVHAHPTLGEALKDAAHGLRGHPINL